MSCIQERIQDFVNGGVWDFRILPLRWAFLLGIPLGHFSWGFILVISLGHLSWAFLLGISLGHFSWEFLLGISLGYLSWAFFLGNYLGQFSWASILVISLGHLSWAFILGIYLGHLSWAFLMGIYLGHFSWSRYTSIYLNFVGTMDPPPPLDPPLPIYDLLYTNCGEIIVLWASSSIYLYRWWHSYPSNCKSFCEIWWTHHGNPPKFNWWTNI